MTMKNWNTSWGGNTFTITSSLTWSGTWTHHKETKQATKLPIRIIKTALKQSGYRVCRDFDVKALGYSETVIVTAKHGHKLNYDGICYIRYSKGKISVSRVVTHDAQVDIVLADPNSFKHLVDTILSITKEAGKIKWVV